MVDPREAATPTERNPVGWVELIRAALTVALLFGWVSMDNTQLMAVMSVIYIGGSIGGSLWARRKVTPMIDPRDNDGTPLVRLDTGTPPDGVQGARAA